MNPQDYQMINFLLTAPADLVNDWIKQADPEQIQQAFETMDQLDWAGAISAAINERPVEDLGQAQQILSKFQLGGRREA
jgi:flavin-binding protein dodecin